MARDQPGAASSQDEELEGAADQISSAEREGRMVQETPWQAFIGVASLIFLAEFGDRSMLATIALGAAQSPVGAAS
jgi:putative Ca2+/H+ antiporter (TMEM165/GDT1 family)